MAGTLVGLALVVLQGALLASWLWPGRAKPVLLLAVLALPVGLAASSSAYFLWGAASGGRTAWFPGLELGATVLAAAIAWRRARARPVRALFPARLAQRIVQLRPALACLPPLALVVLTAIVLVLLFRLASATSWGHWDAWVMINLKARFLCAGGAGWRWAFEGPGIHHPDYPLLLSCSVARLWRWSAFLGEPGFAPLAPQAASVATWLASLGALVAVVARLCAPGMAALAGLAFFALGWDLQWGVLQYTDFAQAALFVWCAGVLALAARQGARAERWWPLLGFLAGASAWCKNEGLAFAAVLCVAVLCLAAALRRARSGRAWARLAAGASLPGLAVLVLKLGFASGSSVFEARSRSMLADLTDPTRYRDLARFVTEHVGGNWTLPALPVLALAALLLPGRRGARRIWSPLALLTAIALVFALVMLTTREDFAWHVATAIDRLLIQLWPLALLAVSAALRPR